MTDILATLTEDLGWRETEIASMRLLLLRDDTSNAQKTALLRSAWAMLYAHYEGFCKNALTIFFDEIIRGGTKCGDLPFRSKVVALQKKLKSMRSLADDALLHSIDHFQSNHFQSLPEFPDVDTQSNLWPSVLSELLLGADLSDTKVQEHSAKIKTLVARRNKIAHGEKNIIKDTSYFFSYENAVYEILYDLAFQIESRLQKHPYR